MEQLPYYTIVPGEVAQGYVYEASFTHASWQWVPLSYAFNIKSKDEGCFYIKSLLLRCIHHFKSDQINNMDHMRISGKKTVIGDP